MLSNNTKLKRVNEKLESFGARLFLYPVDNYMNKPVFEVIFPDLVMDGRKYSNITKVKVGPFKFMIKAENIEGSLFLKVVEVCGLNFDKANTSIVGLIYNAKQIDKFVDYVNNLNISLMNEV